MYILPPKKKKKKVGWQSIVSSAWSWTSILRVMLKSFREKGKGKYEAGLHEWASEVDGRFHENWNCAQFYTQEFLAPQNSSYVKGVPKGKEPLL